MRALRSEEDAVPGDSIMTDASTSRATARPFLRAAILTLLVAGSGLAWGEPPEPLARYIPAEGLAALVEHDGLGAHPEAWKASAAYKMLNETTLGAMLEDILAQVADRALQSGAGAPVSGKELVMLLSHLADKGFAVGYQHNPQPPQPKAVFLVIRDAADSALDPTNSSAGSLPSTSRWHSSARRRADGKSGPSMNRGCIFAGGSRSATWSSRSPRIRTTTRSSRRSRARCPAP